MAIFLLIFFVVMPIAEIYLLLVAGGIVGVFIVIGTCLGTAALGGWMIRQQGFAALQKARGDMETGRLPVIAAVDGVALLLAATLLMTPGFITDFFGFLLLIPFLRRRIAQVIFKKIAKGMTPNHQKTITIDYD